MKLHELVSTLRNQMDRVAQWQYDMWVYLQSEKFQGTCHDYISTPEMLRHLATLTEIVQEYKECV